MEEEGIDLKKWVMIFLRHWPAFLLCLALALSSAVVVTAFSIPVYELKAHVLVNQDNNPLDKTEFFSAGLYTDPYRLENEKGVFRSKSVLRKAINQLDFSPSYYLKKRFKSEELYMGVPFIVVPDTAHLQPAEMEFTLRFLSDTLLTVSASAGNVTLYDFANSRPVQKLSEFQYSDTLAFGQFAGNSYCRFTVLPRFEFLQTIDPKNEYVFKFQTLQGLVGSFRNFKVETASNSSILTLSFRYPNKQKASDFLNKLIDVYLIKGVERDNQIAQATIRFIDNQLTDIVDSLELSGEKLQDFKSANKVLDIGFQAEKVYSRLETLELERARLLVQKRYFNYLLDNLQSKSDVSDLIPPSSLEINDPVLNSLIIELAGLYSERAEISFNSIKDNPYLRTLEMKIDETRRKLTDAARNILHTNEIGIEEKNAQIDQAEENLNRLPGDQQQLLSIERKFKLNDDLYTYLLTRRSEMEIFYASNLPANEVLNRAEPEDARLVFPNVRLNMLIALVLGLCFPGGIIYIRESLNSRIRNRADIRKLTSHPLVGQIIDSRINEFTAVLSHPNSQLTETYRTLRTNLQFLIDETVSNTLLVTSAIQGEGKSFTAVNMASVYAFYGKKTILLDFDLRKSVIINKLGFDIEQGLSNYLSKNATLSEVIHRSDKLNFDIICSGPVPPNPSELVSSGQTATLLAQLKKSYDIIIIDSPPIGIISDALLLYSLTDVLLLVVRYNYTSRDLFETTLGELKLRKIDRLNIVLNDVNPDQTEYGYGYAYTPDSRPRRWNFFNKQ